MEIIKKNKAVIVISIIFLVLILLRSTGMNHFKSDAVKLAGPSFNKSNTISPEKLKELKGSLIINLSEVKDSTLKGFTGEIRNIPAEMVLNKENIKLIMKHDGDVVIYSADPALSARIWMLLSQMGRKDIYILTNESDNEALKFKFQAVQ